MAENMMENRTKYDAVIIGFGKGGKTMAGALGAAVFFAARVPCFAACLACLAYWRFSFHFWAMRESGLLVSSGCSFAIF